MLNPRRVLLTLLAAALLVAAAQAQGMPSSTPRTAAAALSAFSLVASKSERVRGTKIAALRRFASAEITKTLLRELDGAQTATYQRAVISAIGGKKRDGVLPPLLRILDDPDSSNSLCYTLALAIGKQGDAAVLELASRLRKIPKGARGKDAILRRPLLSGLGAAGTEAAFAVLIDAAGEGKGTDYERYAALQGLRRAPKSLRLTALRLECVKSTYQPLKYHALLQLAEEEHPSVKSLALATHKELKSKPASSYYVSQLAEVFSQILDKDTFEAFVATTGAGYVAARALLRKVGEKIDTYEGFVDWLLKKGIKRKVPSERIVSVGLLTHSKDPKVGEILLKLVSSRDPGISLLAIRALGERGDKRAVPFLRRALKSRDENKKIDALHGLHALLKDEPEWRTELLELFRGSNKLQKVLAMDLLAELQAIDVLPEVHKTLTHKSWQVRAAAYDFCRLVRSLDSVEPLIERVDVERGRLREDCLGALKSITSYRLWTTDRWREWWAENRATFKMPTLEQALPKKRSRAAAASTVSFFDIPLVSTRAIFVIDVSGSMSAEMGTVFRDGKGANTRIEEAKRQLTRVVGDIHGTALFNLISFHTRVSAFAKKSRRATKRVKAEALKSVAALKATGGTNIHDALELAFQDDDVDTIYLLSDGAPSAGKITDPNALAAEVARWNKTRRIRIHTISIGSKSRLMERLAKESGGLHSYVK